MKGLRLYDRLLRNYSSVNNRVTHYSTWGTPQEREIYREAARIPESRLAR